MFSKIPHWVVGDQRYTSQIQAWYEVARTGTPGRFCLYEDAFDQLDWTKNPTESWDELLRIRCLQLRHQYKNLKLLYSGGRDSYCILRAFIKNQIPVDELLLCNYSRNPVRSLEFKNWIEPMAHQYKKYNPQVKITTLTVGVEEYKTWFSEDWTETPNSTLLKGQFQPSDFTWLIGKQCRIADSSTVITCGLEKPELHLIDNKVYSTQGDGAFLHHTSNHNIMMDFFFISPELPELHLKQCWLMIEYLKTHYPNADGKFFTDFQYALGAYYDEYAISTGRGKAADITSPSQNGKNKYRGDHPAFQVLKNIVCSEAPEVWNRYCENLEWFYKKMPDSLGTLEDRRWVGLGEMKGKYYFICDWNT